MSLRIVPSIIFLHENEGLSACILLIHLGILSCEADVVLRDTIVG